MSDRSPYDLAAATSAEQSAPSLLASLRTGDWLDRAKFPPLKFAVPGLVPEGLSMLAGSPKVGKSWAALDIALSAASGRPALGCIEIPRPRPVLLCALEDGYRRLQARSRSLLGTSPIPSDLDVVIKFDPGLALEGVAEWLEKAGDEQPLVVIDTLAKAGLPRAQAGESAYERDYRAVGRFKQLIDSWPGSSMLLVHHTRKLQSDDFVDGVSGTAGVAGSTDTTLVLTRQRTDDTALLQVTGRDVMEAEYLLHKDDRGQWELVGDSLEQAQKAAGLAKVKSGVSDRSGEIIDAVAAAEEGIGPKELAEQLGMPAKEVSVYLGRLEKSGRIDKPRRGIYVAANQQPNASNGSNQTVQLPFTGTEHS